MHPADFYPFLRLKAALKGQRFWDATDIMKNETEKLKVFTKRLSRVFQTPLQSLAEVYWCTRRLFWRKCRLNNYKVLYSSEIKCLQELFQTTTYELHIMISLGDVVQWLDYGLYDRGTTVIFFSKAIRTSLQPTRSPIQWEWEFFPRRKIGRIVKAFRVLPSSAEDKKA
jgi:hypothetical protein